MARTRGGRPRAWVDIKLTQRSFSCLRTAVEGEGQTGVQACSGSFRTRRPGKPSEDLVTQLGSPATESGRGDGGPPQAARGSRLARRRRVLLGVGIGAALLAVGGLIGASFVKSPQQLAANTAAPPATVTTATVGSEVLTSS